MKISELEQGPFEGEVEGTIKELEEPKEVFSKFTRRKNTVVNGILEDDSGTIKIALWNQEVDQYKEGDKIKITNGFVSSFKDQLTLSSGRNGKIEKVE